MTTKCCANKNFIVASRHWKDRSANAAKQLIFARNFGSKLTLYNVQIAIYSLVWCFGVFYAIYRACKSSQAYNSFLPSEDFETGWKILNKRAKDVSDYEWAVFSNLLLSLIPWAVSHLAVSTAIRHWHPKVLPYFYVAFSTFCIGHFLGILSAVFLWLQILLMYLVQLSKRKSLCWAVSLLFLILLNHQDLIVLADTQEEYILAVVVAWMSCRCLSFCMVKCEETSTSAEKEHPVSASVSHNHGDLTLLLSYCFYLPLLFIGPLVMYDDFLRDLYQPSLTFTRKKVMMSLANVARFSFWFLFNEFVLHFAYLSSMHYQIQIVSQLPMWSLAGLAFGMSQFFMVKYVVMYGLPGTFAKMEGYDAPPPPRCIARIHLYSDMWKYFDYGLYTFLKRYIYLPLVNAGCGQLTKFLAGTCCFSFVYIWHGAYDHIFIWTMMNLVGVTLENMAHFASTTSVYRKFRAKCLSSTTERYLRATLTAPLLLMSAFSNFYFICGGKVGGILVRRVLIDGWNGPLFAILFFLWCMCHVSDHIRRAGSQIGT